MQNVQAAGHVLVLHNIRSAYNVGAIFRTADAAGVSHVYLTGYTPAPIDRFGRARADIAKAALGAEKSTAWAAVGDIRELALSLKKDGFTLAAVEQAPDALDYKSFHPCDKTAFIFGNEVAGIAPDILTLADVIIEIPMRGAKESLNVSVAAGVVLFRVLGV